MKRAFEGLHISCGGDKRHQVAEAMIDAAKLVQKWWRGLRTKLLYWRYLHLSRVRGFVTANPIADFIANMLLNEPK